MGRATDLGPRCYREPATTCAICSCRVSVDARRRVVAAVLLECSSSSDDAPLSGILAVLNVLVGEGHTWGRHLARGAMSKSMVAGGCNGCSDGVDACLGEEEKREQSKRAGGEFNKRPG